MKNEIFQKFFLKIRTQRYTAEFKNDVISHVGYFTEKLEVRTNINYVPKKVLGNRSVALRLAGQYLYGCASRHDLRAA